MKKIIIVSVAMVLFLTGCSVNFSGFSSLSLDEKYKVKTYEAFKEIEKDLDGDYLAVERIEKMDLKDVDSIKASTVFEDVEIIYEDRDTVEIQYFAFVSSKSINKEPEYNISTKNDFVFEVNWKNLIGNNYGMMRIFMPEEFDEDVTLDSISGDIEGEKILSKDLRINAVSGDITLNKIEAKDIDIESISGDIKSTGIMGKDLDISSTSGDILLSNMNVDGIEIDSISGDIVLNVITLQDDINIDLVSGDVTLTFDEAPSADLDLGSISGDIDCDYGMSDVKIKKDSSLKGSVGAGKHHIDINTISGDIIIK